MQPIWLLTYYNATNQGNLASINSVGACNPGYNPNLNSSHLIGATSAGFQRNSNFQNLNSQKQLPSATSPNFSTNSSQPYTPRLSETEKQNRRDKGLCFRCGEKFTPGHRCRSSTLQKMEITDDTAKTLEFSEPEQLANTNLAEISLFPP